MTPVDAVAERTDGVLNPAPAATPTPAAPAAEGSSRRGTSPGRPARRPGCRAGRRRDSPGDPRAAHPGGARGRQARVLRERGVRPRRRRGPGRGGRHRPPQRPCRRGRPRARHNPLLRAVRAPAGAPGRARPPVPVRERRERRGPRRTDHWFWEKDASGLRHPWSRRRRALLIDAADDVGLPAGHRGAGAPAPAVPAARWTWSPSTAHHGADVLSTHTHSFTHAHRCERQLMRLDHGAAETRIEGWIPVAGGSTRGPTTPGCGSARS